MFRNPGIATRVHISDICDAALDDPELAITGLRQIVSTNSHLIIFGVQRAQSTSLGG
jgi:hypothetical protein